MTGAGLLPWLVAGYEISSGLVCDTMTSSRETELMSKRHRGNESPTMSAATYPADRPIPVDPFRAKIAEELMASERASERARDKRIKAVGLTEVLGIPRPNPNPPIKRRF